MDKDLKIEFRTFPIIGEEELRYVAWRVEPSQLKWWQKLFNPWRLLNFVMSDGHYFNWFRFERYQELKEKYHTVGEIKYRKKYLATLSKTRKDLNRRLWDE